MDYPTQFYGSSSGVGYSLDFETNRTRGRKPHSKDNEMKLIELNASNSGFKTLKFNQTGVSLILGQKSDADGGGGSNGSGKTLALKLIHLCLGSNQAPSPVKECLPEWEFELIFSINGKKHDVIRSGDGKKIALDGKKITLSKYRDWLNDQGVFRMAPDVTAITYRSLISRFARREKEDWLSPIKTSNETEAMATLKSLYLLGVEPLLMLRKINNRKDIQEIDKARNLWVKDPILKNIVYTGVKPSTQINHLQKEIERLEKDLANFEVAEDYRKLEKVANKKTEDIRQIDKQLVQLTYEKININSSLQVKPDISHKELLELYAGLEQFFKPEALAHLSAVEQFHKDMISNRRRRLEADYVKIEMKIQEQNAEREKLVGERDSILKNLHGKKALDEYAAIANLLSSFKEQYASLTAFAEVDKELERKKLELKQNMTADHALAAAYKETNPLDSYNRIYASLTEQMYPSVASGLVLENNFGDDNQLRFDFRVELAGSESQGLNATRIVCFDWLLFMYGQNHKLNFLWHDSTLFSDNDPAPRARWFAYVQKAIAGTGKQYIASLTNENFSTMENYLSEKDFATLVAAEILNLGNAHAEEKLLGVDIERGSR